MTTDIPLFNVHMPPRENLMPELERVLYSGYVAQGKQVDEFERRLKGYFRNPYVLTVNAGTSAIQLALRLARQGEPPSRKYVITTPMTCAATALPVLAEDLTPHWADVDAGSGNLCPESVDEEIQRVGPRNVAAILTMHWGGQPGRTAALHAISQAYGIPLIADAAHALGAVYDGQMTGSQAHADYTCFSLQAIKHITTGDGGLLTMRSAGSYSLGKKLRWFGLDREAKQVDSRTEADIEQWGYKFHMNDIAATIGLAQVPHLPHVVLKHRLNAEYYDKRFRGVVNRQSVPAEAKGSWWLYTLLLRDSRQRGEFMRWMLDRGISVSRVHARLDELTCFRQVEGPALPGVTSFYDRECAIPVHAGLAVADRNKVADTVLAFFREQA